MAAISPSSLRRPSGRRKVGIAMRMRAVFSPVADRSIFPVPPVSRVSMIRPANRFRFPDLRGFADGDAGCDVAPRTYMIFVRCNRKLAAEVQASDSGEGMR